MDACPLGLLQLRDVQPYRREHSLVLRCCGRNICDDTPTLEHFYFKHPEDPAISWYWYTVGGRPTTEAIVVKMFQGWRVLAGKSREAFVCVLSASGNADVDDSREDLRRLSAALIFRNGAQLGYENKMGERSTRN